MLQGAPAINPAAQNQQGLQSLARCGTACFALAALAVAIFNIIALSSGNIPVEAVAGISIAFLSMRALMLVSDLRSKENRKELSSSQVAYKVMLLLLVLGVIGLNAYGIAHPEMIASVLPANIALSSMAFCIFGCTSLCGRRPRDPVREAEELGRLEADMKSNANKRFFLYHIAYDREEEGFTEREFVDFVRPRYPQYLFTVERREEGPVVVVTYNDAVDSRGRPVTPAEQAARKEFAEGALKQMNEGWSNWNIYFSSHSKVSPERYIDIIQYDYPYLTLTVNDTGVHVERTGLSPDEEAIKGQFIEFIRQNQRFYGDHDPRPRQFDYQGTISARQLINLVGHDWPQFKFTVLVKGAIRMESKNPKQEE